MLLSAKNQVRHVLFLLLSLLLLLCMGSANILKLVIQILYCHVHEKSHVHVGCKVQIVPTC